jgi:hypothetical protein
MGGHSTFIATLQIADLMVLLPTWGLPQGWQTIVNFNLKSTIIISSSGHSPN